MKPSAAANAATNAICLFFMGPPNHQAAALATVYRFTIDNGWIGYCFAIIRGITGWCQFAESLVPVALDKASPTGQTESGRRVTLAVLTSLESLEKLIAEANGCFSATRMAGWGRERRSVSLQTSR